MRDHFVFKLGTAVHTKKSMKELTKQRRKGKVTSIDVKAMNSFKSVAGTFDLEKLVRTLSQISTLEKFKMKLLKQSPSPALLPSRSVETLLQCRTLKELVLIDVIITGSTTHLIKFESAAANHLSLEEVRLTNCHPEAWDDPHACLSNLLLWMAKIPSLKTVVCTNDTFVNEEQAVAALLDFISSNDVETLEFKECENLHPAGLFRPLEALKTNTSLKTLEFVGLTPMTDQGLQWIGEMLSENQSLQELAVDCHEASLLPIAHGLQTNDSLRTFRILRAPSYTPDEEVEEAFASLLETNTVLQHLGVAGSRWSGRNIDFHLRLNRAGRQYLWNNPRSNHADWINAIIRCRKDTPIIYELISRNPSAICHLRSSKNEDSSEEEFSSDEDDEEVAPLIKRQKIF